MQVDVESTSGHERRMTLRMPAERLESHVGGRLREMAQQARIKGFRPGKVPTKVIEQRYGAQVRGEVLDTLLREGFDSALREQSLRLAGNPRIEPSPEAAEGELAYVAIFEVVPDFGEIEVETLQVVRHTADIDAADIDRMIENLRLQRRSWSPVERTAADGDLVELETWSQTDAARVPEQGAEAGTVVLGAGAMLPGLELALVGMGAGADKTIEIDFPADWRVPELAGRHATVHLAVKRVSESVLPEVDAEFIRSFGVKTGEEEQFRSEIRTNLERELKGALMSRLRRAVGEQLIEAYAHVDLPPRLLESEARQLAAQTIENARRQGREVSEPDNAHEAFLDIARKRLLVALLVGEIARKHDLRLDPRRLNETLRLIASTYEEPEQVVEMYRNDAQLMEGLQSRVMEEQVIDWIAERAQHTEQALSFTDAIRPQS